MLVFRRCAPRGGVPSVVTVLDTLQHDVTHRLPCFLPDGRRFVYLRNAGREGKTGIYMHSLDGREDRFLFSSQTNAMYASPGYLLSIREKALVAYKFDPGSCEVQNDGIQILDNVGSLANYGLGAFSASQNGTVVVMEGVAGGRQLIWFDRSGKELKRTVVTGSVFDFHFSPDEHRVVFRRVDAQTSNQDIWLLDIARDVQTRFTFDPAIDDDPMWSPDGSRIIYDSNPDGVRNLYMKTSTGAGNSELILKSSLDKTPYDWSRDGKYLLYGVYDPVTKDDLWVLPLSGNRMPIPFLHSGFAEMDARFSPDGQWIVYESDESGKYEIYVQHFPQSGGKWQVSVNGGGAPAWRRDGKEIYYLSPERKLMAVDVHTTDSAVEVGIPAPLFEATVDVYTAPNRYDVSGDGKRFLVNTSGFEYSTKPMKVILHWASQLGKQ